MIEAKSADVGGVSGAHLKSFIERAERLNEEKRALNEDLSDIFKEAKGVGFDTKVIKKIIAMRRRDQAEIEEEETITEIYMRALGMLPLFEAGDDGLVHARKAAE